MAGGAEDPAGSQVGGYYGGDLGGDGGDGELHGGAGDGHEVLGGVRGDGDAPAPATAEARPEHSEKQDSLRHDKNSHNQLTPKKSGLN